MTALDHMLLESGLDFCSKRWLLLGTYIYSYTIHYSFGSQPGESCQIQYPETFLIVMVVGEGGVLLASSE